MIALVASLAAAALLVGLWLFTARRHAFRRRAKFIRSYAFPSAIFDKLRDKHPQLDAAQLRMVDRGLRSYFLFYLRSGFATLGMPSKVIDDLWHEFILDTRAYQAFCHQAFGRFFHHIPSGQIGKTGRQDDSLGRTWRLGCLAENLDPGKSKRLPLLFAIDGALAIAGGRLHDAAALRARAPKPDKGGGGCAGGGCAGAGACAGSGCSGGGCSGGGGCGGGGCGGGN